MPTAAKQFSGNETWSRLNADPMLTMKRVELDKVKKAQENAKIARLQVRALHNSHVVFSLAMFRLCMLYSAGS